MFSKTLVLATFAASVFAAPQSFDIASLTSELAQAIPTDIDLGSLSSGFGAATSFLNILSDLPTLPASIANVLATAVPTDQITNTDYLCDLQTATALPSWYNSLPNNVKSGLSSYQTELASWASEHSSDLAQYTSGADIPAVCTGSSAAQTTGSGSGSGSSSVTGAATSKGNAASSTNSPAAAPRATGAIAGSVIGVVGVLGVFAAL